MTYRGSNLLQFCMRKWNWSSPVTTCPQEYQQSDTLPPQIELLWIINLSNFRLAVIPLVAVTFCYALPGKRTAFYHKCDSAITQSPLPINNTVSWDQNYEADIVWKNRPFCRPHNSCPHIKTSWIIAFKYHVLCTDGKFYLELIYCYLYFPPSFHLTVVCFCPVGLLL